MGLEFTDLVELNGGNLDLLAGFLLFLVLVLGVLLAETVYPIP